MEKGERRCGACLVQAGPKGDDMIRSSSLYAGLSRRGVLAGSGAALAVAGFSAAGLSPRLALARQGTPAATPTPEFAAFFVQFIHFDKFFASFGTTLDEETLAGLYGLDVQTYRDLLAGFETASRQAAEELLEDADFAARVDQLPFAPGDTIVGLGDSITDDLQSWAVIFRHLLELRRADDQIQVVNHGISGDTTADVLRRYVPILLTQPAWIICMLGTNDVQRNGRQATKTLVSLEETTLNLAELRHLAATESGTTQWAWITLPPCDEARVAASPFMAQGEISVHNDDIVAIADFVRGQPEPVVDLIDLFGIPPASEFMMQDGLHPSLAGQQAIARALVEQLTETA
jgi:acyl-CoA thioesterase I